MDRVEHQDVTLPKPPQPTFPPKLRQQNELRILVLSDLHLPLGESRFRALLEWQELLMGHDMVVLLGDTTAYYGNVGEYAAVARLLSELPLPYYVINGNHEFSFVPVETDDPRYGKIWELASCESARKQLCRFQRFYRLRSRFNAFRTSNSELLFLGIDGIEASSTSGMLSPEHEVWLAEKLSTCRARPLVVFCHFPLFDNRLDEVKYYEPARRPYYRPQEKISQLLRERSHATMWFSGHVHFNPPHPLSTPYRTTDGIWQIHCPDGFGYGRQRDVWLPSCHSEFYVRSLRLTATNLQCQTFDVFRRQELPNAIFSVVSDSKSVTHLLHE